MAGKHVWKIVGLASAVAVLAVAGAVAVPTPGDSGATTITVKGLQDCQKYRLTVQKYRPNGSLTTGTKFDQSTLCASPPVSTSTPTTTTTPPPSGNCDRTLTSGSVASFVNSLTPGQTGCLQGTFNAGYMTITRGGVTVQGGTVNGTFDLRDLADGITFRNVRVDGGPTGYAFTLLADDVVIEDSDLSSRAGFSCVIVGRSDGVAERLLLSRNRIHNCGVLADDNKAHGVYLYSARDALVQDNLIYDVLGGYGLQLYGDIRGTNVSFNTLDATGSNRGGMAVGGETGVPTGNTIRDNIIAFDGSSVTVYEGSGNTIQNNCFSDPQFVNRAGHDYRLQPGSPCAGKGVR